MTRCIDISENRKLGAVSPVAMFVFVGVYVLETAVMRFGVMYFIVVAFSYILCQIFFQYSPRFIFMSLKFLSTNSYLTPSFEDKDYVFDETQFKDVQRVLPEI